MVMPLSLVAAWGVLSCFLEADWGQTRLATARTFRTFLETVHSCVMTGDRSMWQVVEAGSPFAHGIQFWEEGVGVGRVWLWPADMDCKGYTVGTSSQPPYRSGRALVRQEDLWVWLREILESINKPLIDMPNVKNMGTTTRNAVQAVQLMVEAIKHPRNAPHNLPHWIAHVDNLAPAQMKYMQAVNDARKKHAHLVSSSTLIARAQGLIRSGMGSVRKLEQDPQVKGVFGHVPQLVHNKGMQLLREILGFHNMVGDILPLSLRLDAALAHIHFISSEYASGTRQVLTLLHQDLQSTRDRIQRFTDQPGTEHHMQIMILISDVGHCLRVADHEMAGRPTWRPGTSAKWSNLFAEEEGSANADIPVPAPKSVKAGKKGKGKTAQETHGKAAQKEEKSKEQAPPAEQRPELRWNASAFLWHETVEMLGTQGTDIPALQAAAAFMARKPVVELARRQMERNLGYWLLRMCKLSAEHGGWEHTHMDHLVYRITEGDKTLDVATMERLLAWPSAQVFEKKTQQEWDQVRERLGMTVRSLAALRVLQELVNQNQAVVATAFEFCITAAALEAPRLDRILRDEKLAERIRADAATLEPLGSHKAAKGAEGSASQAKGKGGKRPAADGLAPAALSAGLAALTDTRAILKAVQKAQAATGQLGTAAAGEAAAGKTSTAQKADGGQAALGKAAVGQTKSAGQAPPKAMQPAVGGASSSPPAAVRQAPGAAASAAAALGPSATDHKVEAARKSKIASEEALSTAIKAATAAKKAAIAAAKRKYTGGATLDECIANDAAEASAVAEKHLTAMRQQAAEAEHAVVVLEAADAEMQGPALAMAKAHRPGYDASWLEVFDRPDTFALISKEGWRVLLALQLVVACVRQGRNDWQEWSAVAVTEHQNVANLSGWAKRTSTTMGKDTEAAAKELDEATKSLCNTACICVHNFLGPALTLTSLTSLEPEFTAMAEQEAQEMSNALLNAAEAEDLKKAKKAAKTARRKEAEQAQRRAEEQAAAREAEAEVRREQELQQAAAIEQERVNKERLDRLRKEQDKRERAERERTEQEAMERQAAQQAALLAHAERQRLAHQAWLREHPEVELREQQQRGLEPDILRGATGHATAQQQQLNHRRRKGQRDAQQPDHEAPEAALQRHQQQQHAAGTNGKHREGPLPSAPPTLFDFLDRKLSNSAGAGPDQLPRTQSGGDAADDLPLQLALGDTLCTLAGPADTRVERAAAAMTAAAQALKPRPGRRSQQQQRPPSPPRAASPAAGSASAASMLPGHPRSGAAAAAAGQGPHLPAAVATARALPGAASQGAPQAHRIPPGFGNLDGFLPLESRPGQQAPAVPQPPQQFSAQQFGSYFPPELPAGSAAQAALQQSPSARLPRPKVFVDPILAHDGTTFERSALLEYLKTSTISPTTGVDLGKNPTLVQNRSIKSAIEHLSR
eukprot:jgi/Astpho2/562/Aster-04419